MDNAMMELALRRAGFGSLEEWREKTGGSAAVADMALMPFPSLKMGPGQSSRSHTADEFVLLTEIAEGIAVYENYIEKLALEYGKTLG